MSETAGSGALSGKVTFTKGKTNVSSCTNLSISNHKARCTITFPTVGNVNVTATYPNDPFFNESFASDLEQVVSASTPVFMSPSNTTTAVGTPFTFNVSADGNPEPNITESGVLPSGVTFQAGPAGSATISGTAAAGTGGAYPISLTATSSGGSANQAFTLTVDEASAITSAPSATTNVGLALTFKVTTTGFPAATVTETGGLPSGMTFKANANGSATIKGTPAAGTGGTYPLTIGASNGIGSASTQDFVLTVNQGPVFTSSLGHDGDGGHVLRLPSFRQRLAGTEHHRDRHVAVRRQLRARSTRLGRHHRDRRCAHRRDLRRHLEGKGQRRNDDAILHPHGGPGAGDHLGGVGPCHRRRRILLQGEEHGVPGTDRERVGFTSCWRDLHGEEQRHRDDRWNTCALGATARTTSRSAASNGVGSQAAQLLVLTIS